MTATVPQKGESSGRTSAAQQEFGLKSRIIAASVVVCVLVIGFGGWAATAQLSGAVIAQGSIVVAKSTKKIQHREGGIVAQIYVQNGDKVAAGDMLIRLDDTQVRAARGVVQSQIVELLGRRARLAAERDGKDTIRFPANYRARSKDASNIMAGETRVFEDGKSTLRSQKEQLALRIEQFRQEIKGLEDQRASKARELTPVRAELKQVRKLLARKLVTISRAHALERDAERIVGTRSGFAAQIARASGQISETRLQILAIDQKARSEAQRELRSVEARLTELYERQTAAKDRLQRMVLRAPISGIVHQLSVHTVGGVVSSAEPLLLLVPETAKLTVEVRFAPTDIDQLTVGQKAKIRFSAFDQGTTPELPAYITHLAADVTLESKTGQSFYLGRLDLEKGAVQKIGQRKLIPGMPAEVFITTRQRTALSYFTKPFTDQLERAFREN